MTEEVLLGQDFQLEMVGLRFCLARYAQPLHCKRKEPGASSSCEDLQVHCHKFGIEGKVSPLVTAQDRIASEMSRKSTSTQESEGVDVRILACAAYLPPLADVMGRHSHSHPHRNRHYLTVTVIDIIIVIVSSNQPEW